MTKSWVSCYWCRKAFLKDRRHIKHNLKLGHKFYCSTTCQSLSKLRQQEYLCENPNCGKVFKRQPKQVSPHNFCSHSCAANMTNTYRFRPKKSLSQCKNCKRSILRKEHKYCSLECFKSWARKYWADYKSIYTKAGVLEAIKKFVDENQRLPVKKELMKIYVPARKFFGTWNKAIQAAGFDPNPVMFAKKQIAKDGHVCDSLAEKLIDDYLYEKGIPHERNFPYPEGDYTADFKVGDQLIEYFGLIGGHKRYDELRMIKQEIARKYCLNLLEIYPRDLYPKNDLEIIFGV